jgi:hypothetical protein
MDDTIFEAALIQVLNRLRALAEEKEQLDRRRAEVDREMAVVRAKAVALNDWINEEPPSDSPLGRLLKQFEEMGLTDACREVLKGSKEAMTPTEVRDALVRMGYDLKKYKNALASIHTILKRLGSSNGVWTTVRQRDKKVAYKWDTPESPKPEGGKVKPFKKAAKDKVLG